MCRSDLQAKERDIADKQRVVDRLTRDLKTVTDEVKELKQGTHNFSTFFVGPLHTLCAPRQLATIPMRLPYFLLNKLNSSRLLTWLGVFVVCRCCCPVGRYQTST